MNILQSAWQHPASGRAPALRQHGGQGLKGWRTALAGLHAPLVLAMLAVLCLGGLLLAFHQVVLQGVQRGESRNRATAAHTEGLWRCNALRAVSQRAGCRVQLDAANGAAAVPGDGAAMVVVYAAR